MKSRIEALKDEVLDLQKRGIRYNILKREAETNRSLYNSLLQRYKEVDVAGGAAAITSLWSTGLWCQTPRSRTCRVRLCWR